MYRCETSYSRFRSVSNGKREVYFNNQGIIMKMTSDIQEYKQKQKIVIANRQTCQ